MKKIIILVLLIVFLLSMRALLTQKSFIERAQKTDNSIQAIRYYERVLLFYVPMSPYNKNAVNGILEKCEYVQDLEQKLYCYETLRTSLYQVRSFFIPYEDEIEKLNPLIAELRAKQMIQWKYNNFSDKDYQRLYNYHMEILKYDGSPSVFWSIIVIFSLIGWISSIIFLIFKGFVNKKYLSLALTSYLIFFTLWILGLYMA
ncbi:hypothetical protein [Thermodesulfovibrio thiophilus]|uniref:hypothetical protein n=1 Tax=Thermodesulfovibrio thiophilus TaxID=340095 RepID=UPI00041801A0|nr:hypothetical protein [Thermodesulfovibrio thiophilus]